MITPETLLDYKWEAVHQNKWRWRYQWNEYRHPLMMMSIRHILKDNTYIMVFRGKRLSKPIRKMEELHEIYKVMMGSTMEKRSHKPWLM